MKVYATDVDGLNEFWSAHRAQKERDMAKNTIQHDQKIQAKRDKDAKRKRDARAAAKVDRIDPGSRAFAPKTISGGKFVRLIDPATVGGSTARITGTGINGERIEEDVAMPRSPLDEPVPVRLTLTGLAKAFEDACSEVSIQEGVLDHALQLRAKARKALDNAADRLANGDA